MDTATATAEVEAPEASEVPEGAADGGAKGEQAPPWGDDFDPARAWQTIQAQRAAESELKKELAEFRRAKKEAEDAKKSEAEKLSESLEEARREAAAARRELAVSRAALKHGLSDDLLEFLTGADEESIEAQAAKLAERFGNKGSEPVQGRPKPRLTPGQGAPDEDVVDPAAIAARVVAAKRY